MAAPFYARYVPAAAPVAAPETNAASLPQKRKRETDDNAAANAPKKLPKSEKKNKKKKSRDAAVSDDTEKQRRSKGSPKKNGVDAGAQADGENKEKLWDAGKDISTEQGGERKTKTSEGNEEPGDKVTKRVKVSKRVEGNALDSERAAKKHAKIISKFEKSKVKAQQLAKGQPEDSETDEEVETHGLEPLPQPAPAPESKELPSYSTLPSWLAEPYYVSPDLKRDFSALGLDRKMVSALQGKGFTQAFPIQAAVMDLVSKGDDYHEGDICISAATGSGKTLAYALPLVKGIEPSPVSRLRGLIVVPTRELVKQAREACELCATGTGLRIGTAVGSTALKDEQQQIMLQNQVYDPTSYCRRNEVSMSADDWAKFNLQDYLVDAAASHDSLLDHVPESSPNVDILICTPGRLVDHIRSTKGFTLEHVQFLVIDEADRLLNESFQEWVEIVMPTFESKNYASGSNSAQALLQKLGKSMARPQLRKIILSATMTRDITKLNSLRLRHPKLVLMNDRSAERATDEDVDMLDVSDDKYRLPTKLSEMFCPVGDGSEKPLYLLKLLCDHLQIRTGVKNSTSKRRRSGSVSSESSTSSDESSGSDTDSDSDTASSVSSASSSSLSSASDKASRTTVLVFTKSSESAARLSRLLSLLSPSLASSIGTLTKSNKSSSSRRTLASYRRGKVSIIVATDRASRGLDLPGLTHVISYDIPASVTSYVHRIGRTARAGRDGCAWTLVAHREGRWWRNEIVKGPIERIGGERVVKKVTMELDEDESLKERYAAALGELEKHVFESTRRPVTGEKPKSRK